MDAYALSRAAADDLAGIFLYTAETFGADQAMAYRDGLIRTFKLLASHPEMARLRHELNPPIRAYRFQSHLIFYVVQPDNHILIVRIRHGREDWMASDAEASDPG